MRRYIIITIIVILFFAHKMSAQTTNITRTDTINISVTVAEKTMIDISPNVLVWTNIPPGTESNATYFDETASGTVVEEAIQIENIGSTNISYIWFNTSFPSESPFGKGNILLYDPGNFVVISRNNDSGFFFVNRVEYNESTVIYLNVPKGYAHGRFRSANKEWFWAVNVSDGNCSDSDFRIGKLPHNQTQLGTVDLTTCDVGLTALGPNECRSGTLTPTSDGKWGYADIYIGPNSNYENYTVAVEANCSKAEFQVWFYHWNMDAPGAQEGATHPEYFKTTPLVPGEKTIAYVKIRVPYGTMAGTLPQGKLTIFAEAINVAG